MADSDLAAIRQARLQQLRSQEGSAGGGGGDGGSQHDEQKSREVQARNSILSQILEPAAADRLGRIRLVNSTRAEDVENRLIMLAKGGRIQARVDDKQLKDMLEAIAEQQSEGGMGGGGPKLVMSRRKGGWDEDDLDDLLNDA